MNKEMYKKLVDLYVDNQLPKELKEEVEASAFMDSELSHEISSLEKTVAALRDMPSAEFSEESYQRILMKIYARGGSIQPQANTPTHLQYHLPIQG
jgi:anti-sigma factor RsiW